MNALKVHCHLKTMGWAVKMPTERLVANVLSCCKVITDEYTVVLLFYSTFTVIVYPKVN
jgi:aminoglycoside N3'-acetyltransferase